MTPKKTAYILEHDALLHFRTLSDFIFLGSLTKCAKFVFNQFLLN